MKIFQTNRLKKEASVATLISDKTDWKQKPIRRNREWHYILAGGGGAGHQENIVVLNMYATSTWSIKFIKETL